MQLPLRVKTNAIYGSHKPNPIKQCARCLRSIGFGYTSVGRLLRICKALVKKWCKDITPKLRRSSACGRVGLRSQSLLLKEQPKYNGYIISEYKREQKAFSRIEAMWLNKYGRNQTKAKVAYQKQQRKINPIFRAKFYARKRVRSFMKSRGMNKTISVSRYTGCTGKQLRDHIESKFKPGMTWRNHGAWHLDHIVPLASAATEQDIIRLCHFSNLQPLWAEENLSKSDSR